VVKSRNTNINYSDNNSLNLTGSGALNFNQDHPSLMRIDESTGTLNTNLEKSSSKLSEFMQSKTVKPNRSIHLVKRN
jgi:hypothetical protein